MYFRPLKNKIKYIMFHIYGMAIIVLTICLNLFGCSCPEESTDAVIFNPTCLMSDQSTIGKPSDGVCVNCLGLEIGEKIHGDCIYLECQVDKTGKYASLEFVSDYKNNFTNSQECQCATESPRPECDLCWPTKTGNICYLSNISDPICDECMVETCCNEHK
jgi:hypothetical protein